MGQGDDFASLGIILIFLQTDEREVLIPLQLFLLKVWKANPKSIHAHVLFKKLVVPAAGPSAGFSVPVPGETCVWLSGS